MATSLIQPFVDQENASSVNTSRKTNTTGAPRPIIGKTFSTASTPLFTPRRAFGDVSNDPVRLTLGNLTNTVKKPGLTSTAIKKGLTNKKITLKKSTQTPSTQSSRKVKTKPVKPQEESYPPIETMHIYEDKLPDFETLPAEERISSFDLLTRTMPMLQTGVRDVDDIAPPDFSFLSLYLPERPDTESTDFHLATGSLLSEQLLDLPPVDEVEFLDLNSILKDLEI